VGDVAGRGHSGAVAECGGGVNRRLFRTAPKPLHMRARGACATGGGTGVGGRCRTCGPPAD
jgi:hypothetical protein